MPRTETITRKLYQFDELSDKAKEAARDWFREIYSCEEWWECTYEDAARAGLKITSFDLHRNLHACGEFTDSPEKVAKKILADHGEDCETFKTATAFLAAYKPEFEEMTCQDQYAREELAENFLRDLLHDYAVILQKEIDYLYSDESVDENIRCNEYEFLESGERA